MLNMCSVVHHHLCLHIQGYRTFYTGKYLNQYGVELAPGGLGHVPPGWDEWAGLKSNSRFYNYSLSINGEEEKHGDDYDNDYLTDVMGRKAADFLDNLDGTNRPNLRL